MKIVTTDGQQFDTMKEARAHERSLKPAGPRTRDLDALPEGLAPKAFADLNSDLAKQLVTLGSQIARARIAAGLTKPRGARQGQLSV